ncbi:MAG: mannonate dehydratase, partial [Acidobacteriota bacterium]|nr:mannonate dehydratase [Acidobacteriota bacterium]
MNRRLFLQLPAPLLAAAQAARTQPAASSKHMKLGTQHGHTDDILHACAAFGVNNICSGPISAHLDEKWSVDSLTRFRERVEGFGLRLDMVPLPLSSSYITKSENPNIMLGKSPERDREIDNICQMIRNCGQAGIPSVKYNQTILGVVRSGTSPGRGGALYSTFVFEKAKQDPPLTEAGPVSADMMWERITYFLKRVVPVAEESKVRLACHPHDPGMPRDKGFRG